MTVLVPVVYKTQAFVNSGIITMHMLKSYRGVIIILLVWSLWLDSNGDCRGDDFDWSV